MSNHGVSYEYPAFCVLFHWVFIRYSVTRSEYRCAICVTVNREIRSSAGWLVAIQFFPFYVFFGVDFHYAMRVDSQADKLPPVPRHMLICLGV